MDVELTLARLAGLFVHAPTIHRWRGPSRCAASCGSSAAAACSSPGTVGFRLILGEGWLDSFYRTVVTGTLNGLDSPPHGAGGKLWTVVIVLGGLTIFAYVGAALVEAIAGGVISGAFAERRRWRAIERLSDHYIICGYGRVGRRVGREFRASGVPYVVLDFSDTALDAARECGDIFVEGNGTEDEDLAKAGLGRARGLVASSDSDADNLYITLSARSQRPELRSSRARATRTPRRSSSSPAPTAS